MATQDPVNDYPVNADGEMDVPNRQWTTRNLLEGITTAFQTGQPAFIIGADKGGAAPLVNSPTSALVKLAKTLAASPLTSTRQRTAKHKMQLWENNYRMLLLERLKEMFHPENFARMQLQLHLSTNLLRRIVSEISVIYEQPARRNLVPRQLMVTDGSKGSGVTEPGNAAEPFPTQSKAAEDGEGRDGDTIKNDDAEVGDPDVVQLAKELGLNTDATEEPQDPAFERLMRFHDWDVLLDTVEKLCRFLPCVWVHPNVNDGELNYIIYTPAEADIVPDPANPSKALAFFYWGEEFDPVRNVVRKVIHYFEPQAYTKFDAEWKPLDVQPNLLGRLPITVFRLNVPINKYFNDGEGDDLYEGTLELAALRTMQNARVRDSAFKQIALQGDPESIPADQVLGGPTPLYLGDGGNATVLDLQANLKEYTDLCRERGLELAAKFGITASDYTSDKTPQSGFAKKLDQAKINKESRRSRKFFAQAEKDLYQLTAVTLQKYPVPDIGVLDPNMELETDFGEPTFEEDPEKQARVDALELKLNKTNILEILRRDDPDASDLELLQQMKLNQQLNQTFLTGDELKVIDLLAQEAEQEGVKGAGKGGASSQSGDGASPSDQQNGGQQ